MMLDSVQVWGDSVLKGVVYDEARGRYALLKEGAVQMVARESGISITNRSQMGRTAPEGLMQMRDSRESMKNALVLIEYGGNDCDFAWAEVAEAPHTAHKPRTSTSAFLSSLREMAALVRARGGEPVLCTLPPLDAHKYFEWITRGGVSREGVLAFIGVPERIYRWQEYYSSLIQRAARELGCECLQLRDRFLELVKDENVWCIDGIHPNQAGHRIIADAALCALAPSLILA